MRKNIEPFLGVPISHQGELQGVLVAQQVAERRFRTPDIAFLVTLAAQLAGGIAFTKAKGVINSLGPSQIIENQYLEGIAGAPGVAVGIATLVYTPAELEAIPDRLPEDIEAEIVAFRATVALFTREFEQISANLGESLTAQDRALFDAYAKITGSDLIVDSTIARIRKGNWAPGALRETLDEHVKVFEAMEDNYLRERANDIRDIGRRLLTRLHQCEPFHITYPEDVILVGDNLSPVDLANVPKGRLKGLVCGHGSTYSHLTTILARAFGIPVVVGVSLNVSINQLDGESVIVDGYLGRILVSPPDSILRENYRIAREESELSEELKRLRDLPAETQDGIRIPLYTNVGLLTDLSHTLEVRSQGIGLYRTELPFMTRQDFPNDEEQRTVYRQVLETFAPRPVIVRTLDIGGDKALPYFPVRETNPFLGWRGIRVSLDHPEIFLTQLRAILKAAQGLDNIKNLLPMISRVEELDKAIELIRKTHRELSENGISVHMPACGAMIEVPSAVYQVESLAKRVDFLSVGINDLTQYLLAVDRNNARVARWFDALHPAVLRAVKHVVDVGHDIGKPVGICGEAVGDPSVALLQNISAADDTAESGERYLIVEISSVGTNAPCMCLGVPHRIVLAD